MQAPDPQAGLKLADQLIAAAKEEGATFLDLGNLGLNGIPNSLVTLKDQLTGISFGTGYADASGAEQSNGYKYGKNRISNFAMLGEFPLLNSLSLVDMEFATVTQIEHLRNLKVLNLKGTGSISLDSLAMLGGLTWLSLENCDINNLNALYFLPHLQSIDLKGTKGADLGIFSKCPFDHLVLLNLSNVPRNSSELNSLSGLKSLERLYLGSCALKDIEGLKTLTNLKTLSLRYNKIVDLRPLANLTGLGELHLSGNRITDISPIADLKNLTDLSLRRNKVSDISPLANCTRLEKLRLNQNQIQDASPLSNLTSLKRLAIKQNPLGSLKFLTSLKSLIYIGLSDTGIEDLAPLAGLVNLRRLNISGNPVKDLTPLRGWFRDNGDRIRIVLNGKEIAGTSFYLVVDAITMVNPPRQYLEHGVPAVLSYWDRQDEFTDRKIDQETLYELKLIIVGNSNSGKSTLVHYLTNRRLPAQALCSTHGLTYSSWQPDWKIDDQEITVNIIDFGGQEYYHGTHHMLFSRGAIYLLLWNPGTNENRMIDTPVGDRTTNALIRHFNIRYWLNAIEIYSGSLNKTETVDGSAKKYITPVLLVQTYEDKYGKCFLNLRKIQEAYDQLFDSVCISLGDGQVSGLEILHCQLEAMVKRMAGQMQVRYPADWIRIKRHIEDNEENYQILTIPQFRQYFGLDYSDEEARMLCISLNFWGVALYRYRTDESDVVIINPQNFTARVNKILTDDVRKNNGLVTQEALDAALGKDRSMTGAFIRVLKMYNILFELPAPNGHPRYIAPMYLAETPDYIRLLMTGFVAYYQIRYEDYFHKGILLECFKLLGDKLYVEDNLYLYWQWGIVLKKGGRVICIEFDKDDLSTVQIKMIRNGNEQLGDDELLDHIFAAFRQINDDRYASGIELSTDGTNFAPKSWLLKQMELEHEKVDIGRTLYATKDFLFLLSAGEKPQTRKRVFVSYSSKDADSMQLLSMHLETYRKAKKITYWHDLQLRAAEQWDERIREEMENADILIMLLSPAYLGSDYIVDKEIPLALRHAAKVPATKTVAWVLIKPCRYEIFPEIAAYTVYPLKATTPGETAARQRAVSEGPEEPDRIWTRLVSEILEK